MPSGVYAWWNSASDKLYVGSAVNIEGRRRHHVTSARRGLHKNRYFQRAWDKYGEHSFHFYVLAECPVAELLAVEQSFINLFESFKPTRGYNLAPRAGNNLGVRYSDESRARISAAAKLRPPPTVETRTKLAEAMRGRTHAPEIKARIASAHRGKKKTPWSDAARLRVAASRTGKKRGPLSESAREKALTSLQKAVAALLERGLLIETPDGLRPSAQFKELISKRGRGRKHTESTLLKLRGRQASDVTRAKLSAALRGRTRTPFSEEHRKNMSRARLGKKRPPRDAEWSARISAALTGRTLSADHREKIASACRRTSETAGIWTVARVTA